MTTVPFSRSRTAPLSQDLAKRLPANLDAERSILGAVLLDNSAMLAAMKAGLNTKHFFLDQHQKIWTQMLSLGSTKTAIDLVTLTEELNSQNQLDAAGGGAYISALADGMPRVSNVAYYCGIVIEKATRREMIHVLHNIQQRAWLEDEKTDDVIAIAAKSIAAVQKPTNENPAVVVGFRDLLVMEMPDLEYAVEPLLTIGGTGEIYAWRGTGKSLVATEMAFEIASGAPVLFPHAGKAGANWPITQQYPVLYVYGEMHGSMIRDRARQIAKGHGMQLPVNDFFGTLCKDFQKAWRPNISTPRNRQIVEERIFSGGYKIVILDNISTLWPTSQEGEGDRTAILTDWFMDLNQRGVSVIYLHHAGKSGEQRGSSEKEDMLDFVLKLRRPEKYKHEGQLRVDVTIEKARGEIKQPRWMAPFELSLTTQDDAAVWMIRPTRDSQIESAFRMFQDGMKAVDVYQEIGISRSTAFRYRKMYEEKSDVAHWTEREN
jgi:DnaB-like helicase N terminal domain/AAA domain